MKRLVILVMVVAFAINLSLASALILEEESKFEIISIDVDEAGFYKNGSINLHIQNTGEANGRFSIYSYCYPFEDVPRYDHPDWTPPAIDLLPGEIGLMSLPIILRSCITMGWCGAACGSARFYNITTPPKLKDGLLCTPNKEYLDKNFLKQCNEFGTGSDVIASCKHNVTCEIDVYKYVNSIYLSLCPFLYIRL